MALWSIKHRLVNGRSNLGHFAKNRSSKQGFVFLLSNFQSISIRRLSLLCRRQDTSWQDWIRRGTKSEGKPLTVLSALIHQKLFTSPLPRLWRVPATLPYPDLIFTTRTLPGKVLKISGFRVVTIHAVSTQDDQYDASYLAPEGRDSLS